MPASAGETPRGSSPASVRVASEALRTICELELCKCRLHKGAMASSVRQSRLVGTTRTAGTGGPSAERTGSGESLGR